MLAYNNRVRPLQTTSTNILSALINCVHISHVLEKSYDVKNQHNNKDFLKQNTMNTI